ncbi:MAG: hypothetical protein N2260_10310 [Syntrophobacterales bacterium]|nr:hypothetical protein [Syntrophobacterales bacterium]
MRRVSLITALILILGIAGEALSQPPYAQGRCPFLAGMTPIKLSGTIEFIEFPMAILRTPGGETYNLRLGPWWFWREMGYTLNIGEKVEVDGFKSADFIAPSVIRGQGKEIKLRDNNGYPLWGGGGGPRGRW